MAKKIALYGYSEGLKAGDRVILFGTVADVSESGVEEIIPDSDPEGVCDCEETDPGAACRDG